MSLLPLVLRTLAVVVVCLGLTACAGAVVGTVADVAIEVVKIPFKVAGAVIDVAVPDEDD